MAGYLAIEKLISDPRSGSTIPDFGIANAIAQMDQHRARIKQYKAYPVKYTYLTILTLNKAGISIRDNIYKPKSLIFKSGNLF